MTTRELEIRTAAEYMCVQLHPAQLRRDYVMNIRVLFSAEPFVYVIQALSTGLTGICIGLLTNYLYDKFKRPDARLTDIQHLLKKQEEKLVELESMIATLENNNARIRAEEQLAFHRRTLLQIQGSDATITAIIEETLLRLETYGQSSLGNEIGSHLMSIHPNP